MYEWLLTALKQAFREERLLKRSPRGSVHLLRHEAGGQRFVLRRFTGNAEVYLQAAAALYLPESSCGV